MAYPSIYAVTYSYTGFQLAQGNNSFPGTQMDADLAGLVSTIDGYAAFLQNVVRADGKLQNGCVTLDSLSVDLRTNGLAPAQPWATGTSYLIGASAVVNSTLYRVLVPHTSGVFATDLAAGKWQLVTALVAGTNGANGADGKGYGGTSTTSLLIANGATKIFATQAGLAYQVGSYVRASSAANGSNFMEGYVTAYAGTALSILTANFGGAGTLADWTFATAGVPGVAAGSLVAANNLSDVASAPVAIRNLGGFDLSVTVPVTTTTTLTTSGFGKLHLVSGTSANYAITIPTPVGNAGALMAFMIDLPANANKLYSLTTPAGVIGKQGATFIMWASETVVLRSDGTNWAVLDGRAQPFSGKLIKTTDQAGFNGTFANVTFTAASDDPTGLNLAFVAGIFQAPRKAAYHLTAYVYATQSGGSFIQTSFDGANNIVAQLGSANAGTMLNFGQFSLAAAASRSIQLRGDGTSLTAAGSTVQGSLTYLEIPAW